MTRKRTHGGRRSGSGSRSLFRGKFTKSTKPLLGKAPAPHYLLLTQTGHDAMLKGCARLSQGLLNKNGGIKTISRNEFIEGLIRVYGQRLTLRQLLEVADE